MSSHNPFRPSSKRSDRPSSLGPRYFTRRRPYADPRGSGADIVLPGLVDEKRLQKEIDLHALKIKRHIRKDQVHLVHFEAGPTLVYVVQP